MMSHFNDVTHADLCLAPIPRLAGPLGGYIDTVCVHADVSKAVLVIYGRVWNLNLPSTIKGKVSRSFIVVELREKITLRSNLHSPAACSWHAANGDRMDGSGLCVTTVVYKCVLSQWTVTLLQHGSQLIPPECVVWWNCQRTEHHLRLMWKMQIASSLWGST